MLLKYEWKLLEGGDPDPISQGMNLLPDSDIVTTLLFRRRKEQVDIDNLIPQ